MNYLLEKFNHLTIPQKFSLLSGTTMILLVLVITLIDIRHEYGMVREETENRARLIASSLALEGSEAINQNLYLIQDSLEKFSFDPDIKQIFFVDESGMIVASKNAQFIGDTLLDKPLFQKALSLKQELLSYAPDPENGEKRLVIFEPVLQDGVVKGWIRLEFSQEQMLKKSIVSIVSVDIISIILTLLAILVVLAFSSRISRTLKSLSEAFHLLAAGNFSAKMRYQSWDELGILSSSYNILVDQIKEMVGKLESRNLQTETELKDAERAILNIALGISGETGNALFSSLIRRLTESLLVDQGFIGELTAPGSDTIRTIAFYARGKPVDSFEYALEGTPSARIVGNKPCTFPERAAALFPKDKFLLDHQVECYSGYPLFDSAGTPLGLIAVMGSLPMKDVRRVETMLKIFAARAGAELERKRSEEKIRRLAFYDEVTGLPNRTSFYREIESALDLGHRERKPVAILLMDLDRFKEINDTLGHHRGDDLLKKVGDRLKRVLRPTDTVARLGGDEFGLILPGARIETCGLVAGKIMSAMEESFDIEGLSVAVGMSVGAALFPEHGLSAYNLVQKADVAMYASKKSKTPFTLYDPRIDPNTPRKLTLVGELRKAIDTGQIFMNYQPRIEIFSGRVTGAEALVRWKHPSLGIIPPDEFIQSAEQTGQIKPLTDKIIRLVTAQGKEWNLGEKNLKIAVNLSVYNLQDPKLPEMISQLVREAGISPSMIELEITESALMTNPEAAEINLMVLHQLGFLISIDDFGVGYASLVYLKKLPVNILKIDRSFVSQMVGNPPDEMIVRSTIDLAHTMGLTVVAEGVENKETLERLALFGCDEVQGYYFTPPLPPDQLFAWIDRHHHSQKSPHASL